MDLSWTSRQLSIRAEFASLGSRTDRDELRLGRVLLGRGDQFYQLGNKPRPAEQ